MNNPLKILRILDKNLSHPVSLLIYGRAAIALGFPVPPDDAGTTMDVDAILPMQELDAIVQDGKFWEALDQTNQELESDGLYMTHIFQEDQVILSPNWLENTVPIELGLNHIQLRRPSTLDLVLTKMMRGNDPKDLEDAGFLIATGKIRPEELSEAFKTAIVPDVGEIREAFQQAQLPVMELARKLAVAKSGSVC